MALTERIAPRRAWQTLAKTAYDLHLFRWLRRAIARRQDAHVKDLSAHHLRDIGLTPADVEVWRHRLPSQHSHHPRG